MFAPLLSLNLGLPYITADAFVIREKLGISFARLIPEVSAGERERERIKSARPEKKRVEKKEKKKKGCRENQSSSLASVRLCPSKNCDSFLRAWSSEEPETQEMAGRKRKGEGRSIKKVGNKPFTCRRSSVVKVRVKNITYVTKLTRGKNQATNDPEFEIS